MTLDLFTQKLQNYGMIPQPDRPNAYTPYAAGYKLYGGGRSNPTQGPVEKEGYREREVLNRARRNAVLRRMQAEQAGNYMSPAALKGAK